MNALCLYHLALHSLENRTNEAIKVMGSTTVQDIG